MLFLTGQIRAVFLELVRTELGFEELESFHKYAGVGTRLNGWRENWNTENKWEIWGFAPGPGGGYLSLSSWCT